MKAAKRRSVEMAGLLLGVITAETALADEVQFGIRAGGNYSDNVQRVPEDEISGSSAIVGFDVDAQRDAGRLLYDVFGNVEYQHFFEDGIDDETFGQVYANSSYAFVPERFLWGLSGSFDQTRRDLLRPVAPGNLDDVLTLSTGPQWTMRFANSLETTLEGHYVIADYSEQPFDSDTLGGSLIFGRRLSENRFIGFGASTDAVTYNSEGTTAEDFDRIEYFLRVSAQGARTQIDLDAGYAELEAETFSDDGPMFRLQATRQLTPALSAFVDYSQTYPTSGAATFSPDSPPMLGTDSSVLTGAPRESEDAEIGLRLQARRTSGTFSYIAREETELEDGTRRNFDVLTASVTYSFAPRASAGLYARFTNEEVVATESDEEIFGGRFNMRLGRLTTLSFRIEHRSRDSDVLTASYDETSCSLFLRYGGSSDAEGWR